MTFLTTNTKIPIIGWNVSFNKASRIEFLIAGMAFVWGIWVLNPFVDTFSSAPIFSTMIDLVPESIWGGVIALVGVFQFVSALSGDRTARRIGATLTMFGFATIATFCAAGDIHNTATVIYGGLTVFAYVSFTEVH